MTNTNTNATVYVVFCRDWSYGDFRDSVVRVFRNGTDAVAFCAKAEAESASEFWWTEVSLS